jgi:hypothetical protein
MKRLLIAVLLMTCGTGICSAQARKNARAAGRKSIEETLISNERRSWEAVKRKDYEAFESILAEDFYDIFSNGQAVTKKELMRDYIRGVELIDYSLSKFKVVVLNRGAAIVVYEATAHGAENSAMAHDIEKGQVIAIHVAVTSAWARRSGRWLNVFYRENDIK